MLSPVPVVLRLPSASLAQRPFDAVYPYVFDHPSRIHSAPMGILYHVVDVAWNLGFDPLPRAAHDAPTPTTPLLDRMYIILDTSAFAELCSQAQRKLATEEEVAHEGEHDVAHFDSTFFTFDNNVATEYISGSTQNPLVVGFNDTTNSDKRIFASDANATMRACMDEFILGLC
ncbi:hypothetical protein B0H19DRAFT_1267729 [Mycena capillaripes]|nr:hypothetical protein B0H19DRAFT_1267729 [Mycena capillaripes]